MGAPGTPPTPRASACRCARVPVRACVRGRPGPSRSDPVRPGPGPFRVLSESRAQPGRIAGPRRPGSARPHRMVRMAGPGCRRPSKRRKLAAFLRGCGLERRGLAAFRLKIERHPLHPAPPSPPHTTAREMEADAVKLHISAAKRHICRGKAFCRPIKEHSGRLRTPPQRTFFAAKTDCSAAS